MEIIRGKSDISYHLLSSHIYMLKKKNPRSMAELKTDEMNNLLHLFVAFEASIK